jgi:hypothetical protein
MTGITVESFVPPIELEAGASVVIEVPELPASDRMAVLAFGSQSAPMDIVALVAGVAGCRSFVFIEMPFMAAFAGNSAMFPDQGIFRIAIMVKGDSFPFLLVVAGLAFHAEV